MRSWQSPLAASLLAAANSADCSGFAQRSASRPDDDTHRRTAHIRIALRSPRGQLRGEHLSWGRARLSPLRPASRSALPRTSRDAKSSANLSALSLSRCARRDFVHAGDDAADFFGLFGLTAAAAQLRLRTAAAAADCGCERGCGCEPGCGCEASCGCEPACGCGSGCCCQRPAVRRAEVRLLLQEPRADLPVHRVRVRRLRAQRLRLRRLLRTGLRLRMRRLLRAGVRLRMRLRAVAVPASHSAA